MALAGLESWRGPLAGSVGVRADVLLQQPGPPKPSTVVSPTTNVDPEVDAAGPEARATPLANPVSTTLSSSGSSAKPSRKSGQVTRVSRRVKLLDWQLLPVPIGLEQGGILAMPTRNVNLTDHFDRFIEAGVASGRFSNASEVVREGLRLLEQREQEDRAKLKWLRAAVKEGIEDIDRGQYTVLRSGGQIKDFLHELREEASADVTAERTRG